MMMTALELALTLIILAGIAGVLTWRNRRRNNGVAQHCMNLLEHLLTLLQLLQKHRGLGAQQTSAGAFQREQIAYEIDRQWGFWAHQDGQMLSLQMQWTALKTSPTNFAGHCQMIDQLLGAISIVERHIAALQQDSIDAIGERCRGLEDLARLRGLSSRATNYAQCPIELEVPLRYLCQRLAQTQFQRNETAVRAAVKEICANLLDAQHISITAARCFELLTPIIDAALEEARQVLNKHKRSRVAADVSAATATLKRSSAKRKERSFDRVAVAGH